MRNIILLSLSLGVIGAFNLMGCASTSTNSDNAAKDGLSGTLIKPSYAEKTGAVRVNDMKAAATCPHDNAFEKEDWRRQVEYANACVKAKDWTRTERVGNSLAIHAPLTPWGPYYMALVAGARKDFPRAQWMLELALKKAPTEGIFHFELARMHWELNEDAAAISEMKQASDLNPTLTDAHLIMGQLALQKGDLSEARRYLNKALVGDSKNFPSLMTLSAVEMKAQNWADAEKYLTQAVQVNPRDSRALFALAQMQEQHLNKTNEALANYRTLKQLAIEHKLDENAQGLNLDDKIHTLEKSLTQVTPPKSQVTDRKPSNERIAR